MKTTIDTSDVQQLELQPAYVPTEAEEKIEAQRKRVLSAVASGHLDTMQERVAWILNHHPETRDSDIALQLRYWREFEEELYDGYSIDVKDYYKLTRLTSIARERARVQNIFKLFQASDDVRKRRGTIEESEHEKSVEQHPDYHSYAVYLDESGKTGEHLIVGSMWLLDGAESLKILRRLLDWKKANGFEGEFHFNSITEAKLPQYFGAAEFIAQNSSVMSFKAISVIRAGSGNVNDALGKLAYHLLVRGIDAEHKSGRATLPRNLQVWKDAEEIGRDKLILAELETKLKEASKALFDEKLRVDMTAAVESTENELIQIADLFVSSLNRVLNASGERTSPKDRFGDHLLERLGLPDGPTMEERDGDMTVHIAL